MLHARYWWSNLELRQDTLDVNQRCYCYIIRPLVVRLMGYAPMSPTWKEDILLLNYSRIIGADDGWCSRIWGMASPYTTVVLHPHVLLWDSILIERIEGFSPSHSSFANYPVRFFGIPSLLVDRLGFEPKLMLCKSIVLPLHQTPIFIISLNCNGI